MSITTAKERRVMNILRKSRKPMSHADLMQAANVPFRGRKLEVISSVDKASNGTWEHVSVVVRGASKCPDWDTMCFVRQLFWDDEDEVIQIHPKRSRYVNAHNTCLHLWRLVGGFPWEVA